MRKFFHFKHFTVFVFLCSSLCVYAQSFIVEQTRSLPADLKAEINFDRENYTNVLNENGNKVYLSNPSMGDLSNSDNSTTGEESVNDVTLTINLVLNPDDPQLPWTLSVYNGSGFIQHATPTGNTVTFSIPAGNYDVFADFSELGTTSHIVIKELVEVSEDTTIELVATDADNYISVNAYDENGEVLVPGVVNPETGLGSTIVFNRIIRFTESRNLDPTYVFNLGAADEGEAPRWNFYISDVSDRYGVSQTLMGVLFGEDGEENYFNKFETLEGISESVNLTNNPNNWTFHAEKFQTSPLSEGQLAHAYSTVTAYDGKAKMANDLSSTAFVMDPEEGFRAYLNNPVDDDPTAFLFIPSIIDYVGLADPFWIEESFFTRGNAVYSGENNTVHYGSGNISFGYYFLPNTYYFDGEAFSILPVNPRFNFSAASNPDVKFGDSAPIAVTMTRVIPDERNSLNVQFKGNYGEIRESDFFDTQIEINHSGTSIFSGSYIDFLWQYGIFTMGLPSNGDIEVTLTNNNIEVDGLAGKNVTKLTYNASVEDSPPALQALQFRNSSDEVTTRFQSAEEGTVRIAGADFTGTGNDNFIYNEGNVLEFFYSPYNQDNWTEIEFTNYPEHFFMPAFGDYYEASLSSVLVTEENSWFDVRIVCTDAAGNKQEQIVSPAFKINELNMGIEEAKLSSFVVYPNPFTNELNIQLPENIKGDFIFKATDLSGKLIHSQNRNADVSKTFTWNGTSIPTGTYILSIESNGKTIAKKVIKK